MPSDSETVPLSQLQADDEPMTLLVVHRGTVQEVPVVPGVDMIVGRGSDATVVVPDRGLSRRHASVRVDGTAATVTDLGSSNGTFSRGKRIESGVPHRLAFDVPVAIGETRLILRGPSQSAAGLGPHAAAVETARRLASSLLNVLFIGEAGAGKRTLARMVHRLSPRAATPLVELDVRRQTLEPRSVLPGQTLLLRGVEVLRPLEQDGLVKRLGATRNVRLLGSVRAASADALTPSLRRVLGEVEIVIPSIAQMGDELDELAQRLAAEVAGEMDVATTPQFDEAALQALREHRYTAGIRELRAVVERAVAHTTGAVIGPQGVVFESVDDGLSAEQRRERERIIAALDEFAGNQSRAAKALKISRGTLVSRLEKYGLRRPRKGKSAGQHPNDSE